MKHEKSETMWIYDKIITKTHENMLLRKLLKSWKKDEIMLFFLKVIKQYTWRKDGHNEYDEYDENDKENWNCWTG